MNKKQRFDFFSVEGFKNAVKTDQGFLKSPVFATRVGVFKYVLPDGSIRRELRSPEEVFNADSIATLACVPLTLTHPKSMVNTDNAKELSVGMTGEKVEIQDNKYLKVNTVVTDTEAIKKILDDKWVEVSCGYSAEVFDESGVYEGEEYDAVQKNIRYNHVAIVDLGRAGPEARFRLDSNSAILFDEDKLSMIDKETYKERKMKITLDGKEFEVEDTLGKAIKDALAKKDMEKKDASDAKVLELTEKNDKLEAKCDSLKEENTTLETKVKELEEKNDSVNVTELVKERKAIEEVATKILSSEASEKMDEMSNEEIKKAVIVEVSPETKLDEKSSVYVDARFDGIAENMDLFTDKVKKALEEKMDEEENGEPKMDARTKAMKESAEAYTKPLTYSANK